MIINPNETWCFTGHRPNKLYGYDALNESNVHLKRLIADNIVYLHLYHGINNFISGMALGWDMWAAETVIYLKNVFPKIKLICAIPCKGQSDIYSKDDQEDYNIILENADYVHNVTGIKYFPRCLQIRNEWMVNNSIGQLAGWNGTRGGTYNCIKYADSVNKTNRIIINPQTFEVEKIGL